MPKPEIIDDLDKNMSTQRDKLDYALRALCGSILRGAQANAPVDTGALRDSGRIEATGVWSYQVAFGGESQNVPYARIWEMGDPWHLNPHFRGLTRDGRQAPLNYLKNAGDAVTARGLAAYL